MLTYFGANQLLDMLVGRGQDVDYGPDIYFALSTTAPNRDGSNITEPVGNGYARVLVGYYGQSATFKFVAAALGATANTGEEIHFPKATGAWGSCAYGVLFDAPSGGNAIAYETLVAPISPTVDEVAVVESGQFTIAIQ